MRLLFCCTPSRSAVTDDENSSDTALCKREHNERLRVGGSHSDFPENRDHSKVTMRLFGPKRRSPYERFGRDAEESPLPKHELHRCRVSPVSPMEPVVNDSEPAASLTRSLCASAENEDRVRQQKAHSLPLATSTTHREPSGAEIARLGIENDHLKQRVSDLERQLKAIENEKLRQRVSELEQQLQVAAQQVHPSHEPTPPLREPLPEKSGASAAAASESLEEARAETSKPLQEAPTLRALPPQDAPKPARSPQMPSSLATPPPPVQMSTASAPPPAKPPTPAVVQSTPTVEVKSTPTVALTPVTPSVPPPPAATAAAPPSAPALPRDLSPFLGKWGIVKEDGKAAYLNALGMSFVVCKAAKAMPTPPIRFSLDEKQTTLTSYQGPVFGKMISSAHPPNVTTTTEKSSQLGTQQIVSQWEDEAGAAVLYCRTTTLGKADVCDQRSRIVVDPKSKRRTLVVHTRLVKAPGAPPVVYTRTYEPLLK